MEAQLAHAGTPGPRVIGIDEIAIRRATATGSSSATSCVGVRSGLAARIARKRAWRSSTPGLAPEERACPPCRHGHVEAISAGDTAHAPKSAILFDKFHHAPSRRGARYGPQERVRAARRPRPALHQGQKYTLLSRRENLTLDGKKALKTLLAANKRLNTAYMLKESFGQLWSYEREGWARRFFETGVQA